MKLIFLCGSLEPGRDGVGDYTRRLATELIRQRHRVTLIAIADKGVKNIVYQTQTQEGISVDVTRIPFNLPYKERCPAVKKVIAENKPDWLSLQFVIFSFQAKGLPLGLNKFLFEIGATCKWHIMFHELWLGLERGATIKHKVWGAIQFAITKSILSTLTPQVVHTQAKVYQLRLLRLGLSPKLLPLFPNIPVVTGKTTSLNPQITAAKKKISLIMFGTIHPGAPVEMFVKEVCRYGKDFNTHIGLIIVGRAGEELTRWLRVCETLGLEVELKGERLDEEISCLMQNADVGVTTYPISLVEKSGTVAAMQAHGLPVICVSKPWIPKKDPQVNLPNIVEYKPGNLTGFFSKKKHELDSEMLSRTAQKLILDLQ